MTHYIRSRTTFGKEGATIEVLAPGKNKNDFEINLKGNFLVTKLKEGSYAERFLLGDELDKTNIKASCKDGILRIELSLKEEELPKQIEIN